MNKAYLVLFSSVLLSIIFLCKIINMFFLSICQFVVCGLLSYAAGQTPNMHLVSKLKIKILFATEKSTKWQKWNRLLIKKILSWLFNYNRWINPLIWKMIACADWIVLFCIQYNVSNQIVLRMLCVWLDLFFLNFFKTFGWL